jgi:ureidoglycolate lyase
MPAPSPTPSHPVEPLTAEAFAPFGRVIAMDCSDRRNPVADAFDRDATAVEPRLWVATVAQAAAWPVNLRALERHPFSTQTFLPVNGCAYLVVVCQADAEGQPDLATLRAFEAAPDQGVTYARNVWHHGLTVLQAPAKFAVCMSFTGTGGDDVFVPLPAPIQLVSKGVIDG